MDLFKDVNSTKRILFVLVSLAGISALLFTNCKTEDYPRKPDRPGSGKVRWAESLTPDGWTMVTNENGVTLGYSKSSGLQLIQADGYAFKDLNRNNMLDMFEDWRIDSDSRAAAMVSEIPVEQMMGMKMNPFGLGRVNPDAIDDAISDGNTYDFAFGLNWSGVIKDDRTAKYGVPPVVGRPPEQN